MKKENQITDIVFLLDRSGSMHLMTNDTIGGYNSYLNKMKDENANVTTVLFNDNYEIITDRKPIKDVEELTNKTYYVGGSTALLDAIGSTIKHMDKLKPKKVLFIITTDGYENASRNYDKEDIRKLIKKHSKWEFIYIGADIDSYQEAASIGIREDRTSNCSKSSRGFRKLFECMNDVTDEYCKVGIIKDNWNEELESYINENKKM